MYSKTILTKFEGTYFDKKLLWVQDTAYDLLTLREKYWEYLLKQQ